MEEHLDERLRHLTPSQYVALENEMVDVTAEMDQKQQMLHDRVSEIYGATGVDPKKEVSTAYGETGNTPDERAKVNPNRKQRRDAIKKQKKLDERRRLESFKRAHRHQSKR